MPVTSAKQKHLMQAVEHNPAFAKKVGISREVAHEMLHPGSKKKNPANRMDPALFKDNISMMPMDVAAVKHADGTMMMSHDAMLEAIKHIEKQGRKGDTQIAHINPDEARMLKAHGGAGTTNPKTGLKEYYNVAGGSQPAGTREGYSSGGGGGTAAAHSSSGGGGSATNDVIGNTLNNLGSKGKVLSPGSKSTIGGDIAGGVLTAGATAVAGPLGSVVGGLIGGVVADAINGAINAPAKPGDPSYGHFVKTNDNSSGGSGTVGTPGGGRARDDKLPGVGSAAITPKKGAKTATAANPDVNPTTGTVDPAKSYIDLLLERFKFPYFAQPQAAPPNNSPHEQLLNSVLGQYQGS